MYLSNLTTTNRMQHKVNFFTLVWIRNFIFLRLVTLLRPQKSIYPYYLPIAWLGGCEEMDSYVFQGYLRKVIPFPTTFTLSAPPAVRFNQKFNDSKPISILFGTLGIFSCSWFSFLFISPNCWHLFRQYREEKLHSNQKELSPGLG